MLARRMKLHYKKLLCDDNDVKQLLCDDNDVIVKQLLYDGDDLILIMQSLHAFVACWVRWVGL